MNIAHETQREQRVPGLNNLGRYLRPVLGFALFCPLQLKLHSYPQKTYLCGVVF